MFIFKLYYILLLLSSNFKVMVKLDTTLVYETPLFVGQGTHLHAVI